MLGFIDFGTFFDTPGFGGVVAGTAIVTLLLTYGLTIRWITKGHEDAEGKA